jgi:hypothetical protein
MTVKRMFFRVPGGDVVSLPGGLHGELDDVEQVDGDLRLRQRALPEIPVDSCASLPSENSSP